MILRRLTAAAFAILLLAASARSADDETGFEPLFNGVNLAGWKGDSRFWSVEDGAITGRATAEQPLDHNTFLSHAGSFGDFELRLEFRQVGGNSGVQYRSRDVGDFEVAGYQADLEDGPSYSGMLYEEKGRGILCWRGTRVDFDPAGARKEIAPLGDPAKLQESLRVHDWNEYRIVARGPRLIHRINGVTMIDVVDRDAKHAASRGVIALQLHAGAPMLAQFRNVRLRRIVQPGPPAPEWIWSRKNPPDDDRCVLTKTFTLNAPPRQGWLLASCDNRHVTSLNGKEVARGDRWEEPGSFDVTSALREGENTLRVQASNAGSAAALLMRLEIELDGGSAQSIVSDASWLAEPAPNAPIVPAAPCVSFGKASGTLAPWFDPFGDGEATPASAITVPDGFRVERLCSAKRDQGSWVAMTFDPKGRIVLSPQNGTLWRATLGDGAEPKLEPMDLPLGDAQGLLFAHDSLYVVVNGEPEPSGGLWRCRDLDGDGRYESVERILACGPGGEHGQHGIAAGPDGRLYLMLGNHVTSIGDGGSMQGTGRPAPVFAASSPLRDFAEDLPLSRAWDPNGHAVGILAPGGAVVRSDPAGESWELYCGGFRNAYDLAFSPDGELFTFDSDMEWDVGLPWYRETRVCHVVSGGDFGWRSGSGDWPAYYADSLPPAVDCGLGSPTGIAFATPSNFPDPWRSSLLICDWTYGRIFAVWLEPKGSTYSGRFEVFASGKPLNVTDLEFGPDGALYFTTGGRGTQSGLYRVTYDGRDPPGRIARNVESDRFRDARRAIEEEQRAGHSPAAGATEARARLDRLFAALDSEDRFLRFAARVALERIDVASWRQRALDETRTQAGLEALLALVRADPGSFEAVARRLCATAFEGRTLESQLHELRLVEIGFARGAVPSAELGTQLLARYDGLYPSSRFDLNRELYAVLRRLGAQSLTRRTLELLERSSDPVERIQYAWQVRDAEEGWTEETLARYRKAGDELRGISKSGGGFSLAGYLDQIFGAAKGLEVVIAPATTGEPKWTLDRIVRELPRLDSGRSFESGRNAFKTALCSQCHRVGADGGYVGPDLTGVAGRFSRKDLTDAIVDPSKVVSDQYQTLDFTLKDGTTLTGRIVDENPITYVVNVDPLNPHRVSVVRSQIRSKKPSTRSPMPERLLDLLTLDQVLDLMAYLESGGDPRAKAFQ